MFLLDYVDINTVRGKKFPKKILDRLINNPDDVELSVVYSLDLDDPISIRLRTTEPDFSKTPLSMTLPPYPALAFVVKSSLEKIDKQSLANNAGVSTNLITRVSNGKALVSYDTARRILGAIDDLTVLERVDTSGEVLLPESQSEDREATSEDRDDLVETSGDELSDQSETS